MYRVVGLQVDVVEPVETSRACSPVADILQLLTALDGERDAQWSEIEVIAGWKSSLYSAFRWITGERLARRFEIGRVCIGAYWSVYTRVSRCRRTSQ